MGNVLRGLKRWLGLWTASLSRQLWLWASPAAGVLAGAAIYGWSNRAPPVLFASLLATGIGLAFLLFALRRGMIAPLEELHEGVAVLRRHGAKLPSELPLRRSDELGRLAREVALLAGDRNVSETRRQQAVDRLKAILGSLPDALLRVERSGIVLDANWPDDFPLVAAGSVEAGRPFEALFPAVLSQKLVEALETVDADNPQRFEYETVIDGESRCFDIRAFASGDAEALIILENVTPLKQSAATQDRLRSILDATKDLVVTTDLEGTVHFVNSAGKRLLRIQDDRGFNLQKGDFLPSWARDQVFGTAVPAALKDGLWEGESALVSTDEIEIPVSLMVLAHRTVHGNVDYLSFVARDLSERKRLDDDLRYLKDYDPLTSLYSRQRFTEELGRELSKATHLGSRGAVLLIDLDDFKIINDSLGHGAGDQLLTGTAAVIRNTIRASDMMSRLGGDEFAILFREAEEERLRQVSERLLNAIREHSISIGDRQVGVTASAGIAVFPDNGSTAEEILARADQAMYRAKEKGRDGYVFYEPDEGWEADVQSRLSGEKRIRQALAEDRFLLYAQPILDSKTNQISQFEILLRMTDEENRILPPAAFLSTAERFGLIQSVDRWVVRHAILLMAEQHRAGNPVHLSVNLSGKSLADTELLSIIESELEANEVPPSTLTLEITETSAISDTNRAQAFANGLKRIGCRLALDDFGVGFSSLYHLKHLPVDFLKIDGSFIRELPDSTVDQHLVRAMVEVARALGKRTVAEFVGNEETVRLLQEFGVDFLQGYHIGKPMAVEETIGKKH